jgi:Family of unknown function (DUF6527)
LKVRAVTDSTGKHCGWQFICPACKSHHHIPENEKLHWNFNGNSELPSFQPSIKYTSPDYCCHSIITDGKIHYCDDCTHNMKSMTVDLPDVEGGLAGAGLLYQEDSSRE